MSEELAMRIEAQAAIVDRLDQRGELDRIAEEVRALTPEGMDLEAQGEMADQLADAQEVVEAARAWKAWRAEHPNALQRMHPATRALYDAVCALDGDTTEEN